MFSNAIMFHLRITLCYLLCAGHRFIQSFYRIKRVACHSLPPLLYEKKIIFAFYIKYLFNCELQSNFDFFSVLTKSMVMKIVWHLLECSVVRFWMSENKQKQLRKDKLKLFNLPQFFPINLYCCVG